MGMNRRKLVSFVVSLAGLVSISTKKVLAVDPFCSVGGGIGMNTALGCIPVEMKAFVTWLLPRLFGIVGGISFLLMVYGFISMTTSGGDPKAVQGAKETITSAITGLLLSIFSLFILRLIAVDILHIPGLN